MKRYTFALLAFSLFTGCNRSPSAGSGDSDATGKTGEIVSQIPIDKFLTSENPGKWRDRKGEHELLVRDLRTYNFGKQKLRELEITVPMEGTAQHYLEVGLKYSSLRPYLTSHNQYSDT